MFTSDSRCLVHLPHRPLPAVEVVQAAGVGGELEAQLVGAQGLISPAILLIVPLPAILPIPQEGMPRSGQLGPDLVGAPGDEVALQQGKAVSRSQCSI